AGKTRTLEDRERLGEDALDGRELESLDGRAVDRRSVEGAHATDGGVEVVKAFFLNDRGDLRGDAAERLVLVDEHDAVRLADGIENRLLIERTDRADVDHLGADVVLRFEHLGGLECGENRAAM